MRLCLYGHVIRCGLEEGIIRIDEVIEVIKESNFTITYDMIKNAGASGGNYKNWFGEQCKNAFKRFRE